VAENPRALARLKDGWDGYDGIPTTEQAIRTAEGLQYVPMSDGGMQIELHTLQLSVEIEIGPDGRIENVCALPDLAGNEESLSGE
jgi:hypothetical protein